VVRLVFITQVLDADHPALAQTIDAVAALARRCDEVVVLCDHVGRYVPAANVRVHTFGASSRVLRGILFERALVSEIGRRDRRPDAVLAHMVPAFATLAAPLCKSFRIPLGLWYTHWHGGRSLRTATGLVDVVLSVDRRSFPLQSPKVRGIGHAIDVAHFAAPHRIEAAGGPLRLLALGRITPWKGYTTMLRGLELATAGGLAARLEIRGPVLTDAEHVHRDEIEHMIAASPVLRECARVEPPVGRDQVPELLAGTDVLLSATQPESGEALDKVVYEAAAAGVPVLSSNVVLDEFLGGLPLRLRFGRRDPADLARALIDIGAAGPDVRAAVGLELRHRVVEGHSVDSWAAAVVRELGSAGRGPAGSPGRIHP
jgi:glycosyltransferase involved in cell wall biosynthesis